MAVATVIWGREIRNPHYSKVWHSVAVKGKKVDCEIEVGVKLIDDRKVFRLMIFFTLTRRDGYGWAPQGSIVVHVEDVVKNAIFPPIRLSMSKKGHFDVESGTREVASKIWDMMDDIRNGNVKLK